MLEKATLIKTEPTVLLVDDSITVRELLSMTFNNAGYHVEQARDGQKLGKNSATVFLRHRLL